MTQPFRLIPLLRRYSTTTSTPSATTIASSFLAQHAKSTPIIRTQLLDGNQLQRLSQTLGRSHLHPSLSILSSPPPTGTPLPPGYHLAYFTPSALERDLGADGSDRSVNPAAPFTRRMWAGGEMRWEPGNALRVGEEVEERTRVVGCEAKVTGAGEEMVVVGVEKVFVGSKGVALVDRRNWIFRKEITTPLELPEAWEKVPLPEGPRTRDFTQTPVSLFRFSALTFNGHKIHYSHPWCRAMEGHRNLVVHGPLNLINMLDFWRDSRDEDDEMVPKSITYRATAPIYADETYRIVLGNEDQGKTSVQIWGADGRMGMKGEITAY
ncbi:hypothetical protein MMC08_002843 [Hypocenomyce scalaris]|nr:hypothetical protein [Hypocenomyce scalaris]